MRIKREKRRQQQEDIMASSDDNSIMIIDTDKKVGVTEKIKSFKAQYHTTKKHYQSLSKTIVVYAREGMDCDESVIIRDVYPDTKFSGFGVAGTINIEKVFAAIIRLIFEKKDKLLQSCKYGQKEIIELTNMEVVEQMLVSKFNEHGVYVDNGDRGYIEVGSIRVYIHLPENGKLAQFSLYNMCNENKYIDTGVYMFPSVVINLLRYLNERFAFVDGVMPKAAVYELNQYETDDFF